MPDFAYTALDLTGQKVNGTISADNQREVLSVLAARSLFPVHVDTGAAEVAKKQSGKKVKAQVMANFYGQLASLLRSGVPLLRSLDVLKRQSTNKALSEVLSQVYSKVEDGTSLGEAMSQYPRTFSEMAVNMVRAGAEGGFLEDALHRVAKFTEDQADMQGRAVGAMAYPVFLAGAGTLILFGLLIFIVPKFEDLFGEMRKKGQLPWATDALLNTSAFLSSPMMLIPLGIIALFIYWFRGYLQTDNGRMWRDRWLLKMPGLGKILLNLAVSRFCRVLGTLLHNGVPIIRSLEISAEATGNKVLAGAINKASENITAGHSLSKPLTTSGHFPPTITEMISVAEESNSLDTVLVDIADGMDKRTWRQLDLFVKLLEPVMLLLIAAVVLFVVIALLVPVMQSRSVIR